jgi:hypothetical protein
MKSMIYRVVVAILVLASFAAAGQPADPGSDFSIILFPDVQNESDYYPAVLASETQWIVNSQANLNIQAVLGLGDIVNNGSDNAQWTNADAAMQTLDRAKIPYFLSIGNHDYDNLAPSTRSTIGFNQWFGPARYSSYPWYGGNYNGGNEDFYGTLNINGKDYLFLLLEYVARDAAVNWAASILSANPDKEAIVITHSFLFADGTRVDQCDTQDLNKDNYGDKLWTKLISQAPNISMIVNGHLTRKTAARRADLGVNGNLVNEMFSNYQTLPNGGNGYLRILTFHPSTDTISVKTYSPYLNVYKTDSANQFTINWHAPAVTAISGTISGLVRDVTTCKAIAGAQVTAGTATTTSDVNGHYSLTLAGGSYPVASTATGYNAGSTDALVNNGYDADTNFYMVPAVAPPCTLNTASPSVTICTPASNATVTSPVKILAGTTDSQPVSYMQLYLDGSSSATVKQSGGVLNTTVPLSPGKHKISVAAKDVAGVTTKKYIYVTVQ